MNLATATKSVQKLQGLKTGEITGDISGFGFRIFFHTVKKGEEFKSEETKNNRF
jgi:hypothetical protein